MIPVTRKELYLNKIVGNNDYEIPEKPITIEEFFFAEILGEAVQAPEPLTRYQIYLAKIAGKNIEIPYPKTRLEYFLARAAGMDVETPVPITREEIYWSNYTATTEFELEGVPPLIFKSDGSALKNYRFYGAAGGLGDYDEESGKYVIPVTIAGKNKFDGTLFNGYYTDSTMTSIGGTSGNYKSFKLLLSAGTYTFSCSVPVLIIRYITSDIYRSNPIGSKYTQDYTFTLANDSYVSLAFRNESNTAWDDSTTIQVEEAQTATEYEPYHESIVSTISLDTPLSEGESLSMANTGVQIGTIDGTNILTVGTEVQPSKVYLKGKSKRTIYGWHVDPDISDSSNAVTYLEDAVGMTPAAMGANKFNYGSWGNAFFMPKPCMLKSDGTVDYYLDPNDYTKKADGTPSDVANPDYDGNAMMEWGKIWYKFAGTEIDGEGYFYVSNYRVDNTYHCWCNIDSENNETDHFYTAIYNGTGTTKLRSISGIALTSANGNGGTNATEEVTRATANNTTSAVEWYTEVFSDKLLINALLVLMGKSLNTQVVFGRGLDFGDQTAKEAYITGTLNDKGLFWGVTANGNSAVKVFGMENWWGCVWHRVAGCISVNNTLKVKLTYNTADGSAANGYNQTGNGYIDNGNIPTLNDFVKTMSYNELGYSPSSVIGSSSESYYGDYFYQKAGTDYLLLGGSSGSGVAAGPFCFCLRMAPGYRYWDVAAALSCKPLARKGELP